MSVTAPAETAVTQEHRTVFAGSIIPELLTVATVAALGIRKGLQCKAVREAREDPD